jgi:hypothetical protein
MITENELKKIGFEFLPNDLGKMCWSLWDEEVDVFGKPFIYRVIKFDIDKQIAKASFGYSGQANIKCNNIKDLKKFLKCISFLRDNQILVTN